MTPQDRFHWHLYIQSLQEQHERNCEPIKTVADVAIILAIGVAVPVGWFAAWLFAKLFG